MADWIRAISIGGAVPRPDFEAVVHSAFRHAANLRAARSPVLLTLLSEADIELPQGIRLEAPKGFTLEVLSPGAQAVCKAGVLTLADSLVIDLRPARNWECDLRSQDADLTSPAVAAAWSHAWQAVKARRAILAAEEIVGGRSSPDPDSIAVLSRRMNEAVRSMLEATRQNDATWVGELTGLIGLGPGLTPSGDDLLMGYLAGLRCATRGKLERQSFLAALCESTIHLSRKTNDISRTYLCLAARGQVSSTLVNLAAAICRGDSSASVSSKADAAMRFGHSSGTEAVKGLLLGLAAWDGPHLAAGLSYD